MITKERLLQNIEEGIRTEESAIPIYMKHISTSLDWFGFRDEDRYHIEENLKKMAEESSAHKNILENIRDSIIKEGRDVF